MAIFHKMQHSGVKPDRVTFLTLLNLCAVPGGGDHGEEIHRLLLTNIAASDRELDLPLANAVADMYCKNGRLDDGRRIFDALKDRGDVISWNAMITAYAQHGHPHEAICLFCAMELHGISPCPVTYTLLLSVTISATASAASSGSSVAARSRSIAKFFHDRIRHDGLELDLFVGTGLVNLYASFGYMDEAAAIFSKIVESSGSGGGDVVLWTTMIGIHAQRGDSIASLRFFRMMQLRGVKPNRVTFINVLTACSSRTWLPVGEWIHRHHDQQQRVSRLETSTGNALISMYIKCGDLPAGKIVFDEMERQRDVISWNTVIAGHAADEKLVDDALVIFQKMLQDGGAKPDCITIVTLLNACNKPALLDRGKFLHSIVHVCGIAMEFMLFNALLHMYAKCGSLEMTSQLFHDRQQQHHRTDPSVWGAMIIALSQQGRHREAIRVFQSMQQHGVKPDKVSLTAVLDSASTALFDNSAAASTARGFYSVSLESGLVDGHPVVATALINLLGNTGAVREALAVFTDVVDRDIVCWNAMLSVYAQHGHTTRAVELFQQLQHQGMDPSDVTFVNLISTCSHAGHLDVGIQCFLSMTVDHRVRELTPELTGCVIDLFARVGRLADARDFIGKMPREEARVIQWMSLLCASRVQGDLELSGAAARQVLEIDPRNPAAYVALSNRQSSSAARQAATTM